MSEAVPEKPQNVTGTVVAPLLGVTFGPLPDALARPADVHIVPRAEWSTYLGPWDAVPERDNEVLSSATHAVELPEASLMEWPDSPGTFHLTQETQSRLTDFVAMLCLATGGLVTYAEVAITAPTGAKDAVTYSILLRDFTSRLDAVSAHEFTALSTSGLESALARWRQIPTRHPSLRTAAARLMQSWHRERFSHDTIVDLCIGIEALVGAGSNELVTRISLRAAAMLGSIGWQPSSETAKAVKDIYAYRSQVVHGSPGPYKHEVIRIGGGHPMHAVRFALAVLVNLLEIYFDHEDLVPALIDERFIYAAFDSSFVSSEDERSETTT